MRRAIIVPVAIALIAGSSPLAMAQVIQQSQPPSPHRTVPPETNGATPGGSLSGIRKVQPPSPQEATSPANEGTSGTSVGGPMLEAQVKEHLEKEGYTEVRDLKESGGAWVGKAMREGKEVTVNIDQSGKITEE